MNLAQICPAKARVSQRKPTGDEVEVESDFDARVLYGVDPEMPAALRQFKYEAAVDSP